MKKLFSIILAIALFSSAGSKVAWGADGDAVIDDENIAYRVSIDKTDKCFFNSWHLNADRTNSTIITIALSRNAGNITTQKEKYIEINLASFSLTNPQNFSTPGSGTTHSPLGDNSVWIRIPAGISIGTLNTNFTFSATLELKDPASYQVSADIKSANGAQGTATSLPMPVDVSQAPIVITPLKPEAGDPNITVYSSTPTIVAKVTDDTWGKLTYAGENSASPGFVDQTISWTRATMSGTLVDDFSPARPTVGSAAFKALNDSAAYLYTYKYTNTDKCKIDTAFTIATWVQKDYAPVFAAGRGVKDGAFSAQTSQVKMAGDEQTCMQTWAVNNLPYIVDVADGNPNIDTIQIKGNVVVRTIDSLKTDGSNSWVTYATKNIPYDQSWSNTTKGDTIKLREGYKHRVTYKFQYRFATSTNYSETFVLLDIPRYLDAVNDFDTVKTEQVKLIDVLANDTMSSCLVDTTLKVQDTYNGGSYSTTGSTKQGGTVTIKRDPITGEQKVEYKSANKWQGDDEFYYELSTTANGITNKKTALVKLRVDPSYNLTVKKTVERIVAYGSGSTASRTRTTGLDSILTGDTVYFKIKVTNSGKNDFTGTIEVVDTFPKTMVNPTPSQPSILNPNPTFGANSEPLWKMVGGINLFFIGHKWTVVAPASEVSLAVGKDSSFTFGLVQYTEAGTSVTTALRDTNKVSVNATTQKYFNEGTITLNYRDTLPLRIYKSVNLKMHKTVNARNVDSLYQDVKFTLTVKNIGKTDILRPVIADTLPAGLHYKSVQIFRNNVTGENISGGFAYASNPVNSGRDTVHSWVASPNYLIGSKKFAHNDSLSVIITASVVKLGTFINRGFATELDVNDNKVDIDLRDNLDTAKVIFKPNVILKVKKEAFKYYNGTTDAPNVIQSDTVMYRITVENDAQSVFIHSVEIRDTIPGEIQLYNTNDPTVTRGSAQWKTGTDTSFVWTIPYVAKGQKDTLVYLAQAVGKKDNVRNAAYAYIPTFYGTDSIVDSMLNTELKIREGKDFSILPTKIDSTRNMDANGFYLQGDTATVLFIVENLSPNLGNETVKIQLPQVDTLAYCSAQIKGNAVYDPAQRTWTTRDLNKNERDTLTFRVTIGGKVLGELENVIAGIIQAGTNNSSNKYENDTVRLTLNVKENDLDLELKQSPKSGIAFLERDGHGGYEAILRDTIRLSKRDTTPRNIIITDTLPAGIKRANVVSASQGYRFDSIGSDPDKRYIVKWSLDSLTTDKQYVVNYYVSTPGRYRTSAHATCSGLEASILNNTDTCSYIARSKVDLTTELIAKSLHNAGTPYEYLEGDTVVYTFRVKHNQPSEDATDVALTFDNVPAGLILISATHGTHTDYLDGFYGKVTFDNITIAKDATDSVVILARILPVVPAVPGTLDITWAATAVCPDDIDGEGGKNRDSETINAKHNVVDIMLALEHTYIPYEPTTGTRTCGQTIEVGKNISVGRGGNATNAVVTYVVPEGITISSGDILPNTFEVEPVGATSGPLTIKWSNVTIPGAVTTSFQISNSNIDYPNKVDKYAFQANVTINELDADPINNQATGVVEVADLALAIDSVVLLKNTLHTYEYIQGDIITADVYLHNYDTRTAASNVAVTVNNSRGFKIISTNPPIPLGAGAKTTVTIQMVADTIIEQHDNFRFSITATNDANGSKKPVITKESHKIWIKPGADVKVWMDTVAHKKPYHKNLHYTIAMTNLGQYRSRGLELKHSVPQRFVVDYITDTLHMHTKFGKASTFSHSGRDYVWSIDSLSAAHNDTARVTFYVHTNPNVETIYDTVLFADARTIRNDYDLSNNATLKPEGRVIITKNPYNVSVKKQVDGNKTYLNIQQDVHYTITAKNESDSAAYNVWVTDTLPWNQVLMLDTTPAGKRASPYVTRNNGTDPVADSIELSGYNVPRDTILWYIDTLRAGESLVLHYHTHIEEAGMFINTAYIKVHDINFDEDEFGDNVSIDTVEVFSDQKINLVVNTFKYPTTPPTPQDTFTQGDTILFIISAQGANTLRQEIARDVRIALDTLGIKFIEHQSTADNGKLNDTTFVWSLDSIAAGATANLSLWAIVGPDFPTAPGLLDSFVMHLKVNNSPNKYYPELKNSTPKQKTAYLTYNNFDIGVDKWAIDSLTTADLAFGYTIRVSNLRGIGTDSIRLVDVLPAGITLPTDIAENIIPAPSRISGNTLIWDNIVKSFKLDSLKGKQSRDIVVDGLRATPNTYLNRAQVYTNRHEASLHNNIDSAKAKIVDAASVDFTFTASSSRVTEGDTLTLKLKITNQAQAGVSDLQINSIALPAQFRYISSSEGTYYSSNSTFVWRYSDEQPLAPGESKEITIRVQAVNASKTPSATTCTAPLALNGNNIAPRDVLVRIDYLPYNLTVTKTASKHVFYTSDAMFQFDYIITAKNTRDSALHNIVVRDTLPEFVIPQVINDPHQVGEVNNRFIFEFVISKLNGGADSIITLPCDMPNTLAEHINHVYVRCNEREANVMDNTDTTLVAVRHEVNLKVAVELRSTSNVPYPANHEFRQGDTLDVYVSVLNNGHLANTAPVVVTVNNAPDKVNVVSSTSFDEIAIGGLVANATAITQKVYRVRAAKTGAFAFGAVATTALNGITVKDSTGVQGIIKPGADVKVNIVIHQAASNFDKARSYTVSMQNIGQDTARHVVLSHTLPAGVKFDSLQSNGETYKGSEDITLLFGAHDTLRYHAATRTITYSTAFVVVSSSASFKVFTTTTAGVPGASLKHNISARADVANNEDYYLNNNVFITAMLIFHNPYDLRVTITPKNTDVHNVPSESNKQVEYTIVAANVGRYPVDSVNVYYRMKQSPLIVHIAEGASGSDKYISQWFTPQLPSHDSIVFRLKVAPETTTSKGHVTPTVNIDGNQEFRRHEVDMNDNRDSAGLTLYSWLDAWPIMEAFSPNGDGKNDQFIIKDLKSDLVERAELVIVNRYGSEVYYQADYKAAQEGSEAFTGVNLPEGSYFYRLTVYFNDNTSDKRSGFITIRRGRWNN